MKKVVLPIGIIALIGTVFSAIGWYFVRGIKIYALNTSLGLFLSGSWQICMVATVVIWVVFAFALVKAIAKRKANADITKLEADGKKRNKEGKIEPTSATVIMPVDSNTGATLSPIAKQKAPITEKQTDNIQKPVSQISSDTTEVIMPDGEITEVITADDDNITEVLTQNDDATQILSDDIRQAEPQAQYIAHESTPKICPNCNAAITAGNNFCTSCGTKIE